MKKLNLIAVAATVGVLTFGATSSLHAGALATSVVKFENFTVSWEDTGTQVGAADFSTLTYNSTADVSASLGATIDSPVAQNSTNATPIDMFADVGSHTYVDNSFAPLSSAGGFPTGNFSIGDQNEIGAPITGLTGVASNADLGNASYVSLEGTGEGSATSNNGLTARISFVAAADDELVFDFDLFAFLEVYLDANDPAPSFAQASYSVSLSLVSRVGADAGATLLNVAFQCDDSHSAPGLGVPFHGIGNCGLLMDPQTGNAISQSYTSGTLLNGSLYDLTARIDTAADARFVPEPGILALMGAGLLGLFGFNRRRPMHGRLA